MASAQVSNFGNGCPGASGSTPTIGFSTFPVTGQPFSIDISGVANAPGLLIGGGSNSASALGPLPAPLDFIGMPGCSLNVSTDVLINFNTDANGDASMAFPSGLAPGIVAYAQAFLIDFGPLTLGGMTDGLQATFLAPSGHTGGEVIVTEFMKNPVQVGDGDGEYVEVHNTTASDIDIEGWTLGDDDFDGTVIDNGGAGVVVQAGGYLLLGANGDAATNGNLSVDYDYNAADNGQFFLSNSSSGDEIKLTDHTGVQIDHLAFDGSAWPDTPGVAAELSAASLDGVSNDDPANWASSTCTIAGGPICNPDLGTPGTANDQCGTSPCPTAGASGELIFSEIMQNPSSVGDSSGEWFEVYNTTGSDIDMVGFTIAAGGSPNNELISSSVVVPAGGYALFVRKSDPLVNGGLPAAAYDYVDGLNFSNSSQTCKILDASGDLVCEIGYDNGATFPDPNGASMNLSADKLNELDSTSGANWCESTASYGDGDLGTPGTANETCP